MPARSSEIIFPLGEAASSATAARVAGELRTRGASLTGRTCTVKLAEVELTPSFTLTVTVATPNACGESLSWTCRDAVVPKTDGARMMAVSLLTAVTVKEPGPDSASPTVKGSNCELESSYSATSVMVVIVGASFTGVTSKLSLLGVASVSTPPLTMPPSSWTRNVKLARFGPLALAAGVNTSWPSAICATLTHCPADTAVPLSARTLPAPGGVAMYTPVKSEASTSVKPKSAICTV